MQLTVAERLALRNQLQIMKHLGVPGLSPSDYDERIEILESGYEVFYSDVLVGLDEAGTDATVTAEVFEILDLYRALDSASAAGISLPTSGTSHSTFIGFDGNNESEHRRFSRFLLDVQGKYPESAPAKNSHMPTLSNYRGMVSRWSALGRKHPLSQADVNAILI